MSVLQQTILSIISWNLLTCFTALHITVSIPRSVHRIVALTFLDVIASNSCGLCSGSIVVLFRSKSVQGPWTRQILAGNGCNTQLEGVLLVADQSTNTTTYLFQGNSIRKLFCTNLAKNQKLRANSYLQPEALVLS
jgi:hypothetical protein